VAYLTTGGWADHFCPWMGTAVAGGNIKAFYTFLLVGLGIILN
jgi:hypothetical protein